MIPTPGFPQVQTFKLNPDKRAEVELWAEVSKTDLFFFNFAFMGRRKLVERIHGPICQAIGEPFLWYRFGKHHYDYGSDWPGMLDSTEADAYPRHTRLRDPNGELYRNIWLGMSRGAYKTTNLTEGAPAWFLTLDPNQKIMTTALSQDLANDKMTALSRRVTSLPEFRYVYGHWEEGAARWNVESKFISPCTKIDSTPSLFTIGLTGANVGQHPTIVITDDPVDRRTMNSEELLSQVYSHLEGVPQLLERDSVRLHYMAGTRYGFSDPYSEILETSTDGSSPKRGDSWGVYVRGIYNPDGSLCMPELFDEKRIADLRREHSRSLYEFYAQYVMKPVKKSEQGLDAGAVQRCELADIPDNIVKLMGVDPAGARATGGNWAMGIVAGDSNHDIWITERFKGKISDSEATDRVIKMLKEHTPFGLVVEESAISHSWIDNSLKPALEKEKVDVRYIPVTSGGVSKRDRIVGTGLDSVVRRKGFHCLSSMYDLILEMEQFPSKGMFDLLDFIANCHRMFNVNNWWPEPIAGPTGPENPLWTNIHKAREDQRRKNLMTERHRAMDSVRRNFWSIRRSLR